MAHDASSESSSKTRHLLSLALGALGVVYGDIGTSPLYAVRECFHGPHAIAVTPANVLGVLSLIFWSLVLIISIKYLGFVLRAHNRGEGGILALMALALAARPGRRGEPRNVLVALGLLGAALLYGDGVITPAISVLSAVEGLEVAAPVLQPFVLPVTVAILVSLFLIQSRGTRGLGAVFGPVMLVWFAVLAVLGVAQIASVPSVLAGLSPLPGFDLVARSGWHGFLVLGTVFLVVTGGEALYADLGHFGPRPIRLAWFALAMPCLVLNYLGQGALLLARPDAAANPFYRMAPAWILYPLIGLSTAATIIASQAVISGAFSLTQQAVQLGYCPRVRIEHTSPEQIGQIYAPGVNWTLMLATIALVLGFRSSSNLASAYGVAVTSTMVITTLLLHVVMREVWRWSPLRAALPTGLFLVLDLAFFGANIVKVPQGGWFALVIAAAVYLLMATWKRGRELLGDRLGEKMTPLEEFVTETAAGAPTRVPGTAIFMTRSPTGTPPALVHNLEHNKVLHERVVLINVITETIPRVPKEERLEVEDLGHGFHSVIAHYGFAEHPSVLEILGRCTARGLDVHPYRSTFFLGREALLATARPGMAIWREKLFAFMARNALGATTYYRIPPERVFEVGVYVEL
jgi:KUP system potassium uptake protein